MILRRAVLTAICTGYATTDEIVLCCYNHTRDEVEAVLWWYHNKVVLGYDFNTHRWSIL